MSMLESKRESEQSDTKSLTSIQADSVSENGTAFNADHFGGDEVL